MTVELICNNTSAACHANCKLPLCVNKEAISRHVWWLSTHHQPSGPSLVDQCSNLVTLSGRMFTSSITAPTLEELALWSGSVRIRPSLTRTAVGRGHTTHLELPWPGSPEHKSECYINLREIGPRANWSKTDAKITQIKGQAKSKRWKSKSISRLKNTGRYTT